MKLTWRFIFLIAALLGSVAVTATFGLHALTRLDGALDGVVKGDMERLLAITHTRRLFRSLVVLERDYLLSTSASERQAIEKKLQSTDRDLVAQMSKYERLMPPSDADAMESIRRVRKRWLELDARVLAVAKVSPSQAVMLAAQHTADPISWEAVIGKLVQANEQRLAREVAATHTTFVNARATLLAAACLAGLLAAGLGTVIYVGIRNNLRQVYELNTQLEHKVERRTAALAERERSLRLVLDTTGDGIVGVRADGTLAGNASAAAVSWFGAAETGANASSYLFAEDPAGEALFRLGLSQLLDDILPWQVALDQMPRRSLRGEQILDLAYKRVPGDTELALLVVARDVTARVQSEQAEQEARERQGLVARLLLDKHGFNTFVRDAERMLADLNGEQDPQLARRILHTLKGNVAVYGLGTMARLCHRIEDRLAEAGGLPLELEVRSLGKHLRDKLKGIEEFLSGLGRNVYEVESEEHEALVQSLLERRDYTELLEMVETWTWPRAAERLARLRNEGEYLARRLDKQVRIELEHNDLRLPEAYLERFWPTLTHVVRNAIDHGIETPEQRRAAGKPSEGVLRLRTTQVGEHLKLELEDDGAGVNLPAVRAAAERRGLTVKGDSSDVGAIFQDGVSTRVSITEVSGRGIGLSATRDACLAEGGRVDVTTRTAAGTCFTFVFHRPVVDTEAVRQQREPRWRLVHRAPAADPSSSMTLLKVVPQSPKSARESSEPNKARTSAARKE